MPATKKPGRSITFTIVPLPGATTVVCDRSQRAVSSCARVVSTCASDTFTCACAVAICALTCATVASSPLTRPSSFSLDLLLGRARRGDLRRQLVDVRLRLLEVEAVARAGRHELGVLRRRACAPARARRSASPTWLGRLRSTARSTAARSIARRPACACASASRSRSAPTFASSAASRASSECTSFWYGVGSIRNSTSPFFTGRLFSTGTSMTRPRTCDTTGTTYLTTRTSLVVGAKMFSSRSRAAIATTGKIATADLPRRRPRQQLQLDEDQPDEERVDAEEDDFHYRASSPRELGFERVEIGAQRRQLSGRKPAASSRASRSRRLGAVAAASARRVAASSSASGCLSVP